MMNEDWFKEYHEESWMAIEAMMKRIENKLKVYSDKEAFEFLKPIRSFISAAEMQLDDERNKRINTADDILKNIKNVNEE